MTACEVPLMTVVVLVLMKSALAADFQFRCDDFQIRMKPLKTGVGILYGIKNLSVILERMKIFQ